MYGGGYWLWGLEIFDPTGNAKTSAHGAISIYGAQSRIINCYIHGNKDRSGIIAGDQVPKYSSEWGLAQIEAGSPHKVDLAPSFHLIKKLTLRLGDLWQYSDA